MFGKLMIKLVAVKLGWLGDNWLTAGQWLLRYFANRWSMLLSFGILFSTMACHLLLLLVMLPDLSLVLLLVLACLIACLPACFSHCVLTFCWDLL